MIADAIDALARAGDLDMASKLAFLGLVAPRRRPVSKESP